MADVAVNPPTSQETLGKVRGLSSAWRGNDIGARMMEALANAEPLPASSCRRARIADPGSARRAPWSRTC